MKKNRMNLKELERRIEGISKELKKRDEKVAKHGERGRKEHLRGIEGEGGKKAYHRIREMKGGRAQDMRDRSRTG